MHRLLLGFALVLLVLQPSLSICQDNALKIGVTAGVAIPIDDLARAYNIAHKSQDAWTAYDAQASIGMHVGARIGIPIAPSISIVGGVSYNRFFSLDQQATLESGKVITMSTASNIIPIHAGVQLYIARWILSPYVSAEIAYVYRNVTVSDNPDPTFIDLLQQRGVEIEPTTSRFGGCVSAGFEVPLGPITPFLEFKVTSANLIGRDAGEPSRVFATFALGFMF